MESSGWEKIKRQLAEALAKHLTTCGFKSTVRGGMRGCLGVTASTKSVEVFNSR